jgi:hypothetical protein
MPFHFMIIIIVFIFYSSFSLFQALFIIFDIFFSNFYLQKLTLSSNFINFSIIYHYYSHCFFSFSLINQSNIYLLNPISFNSILIIFVSFNIFFSILNYLSKIYHFSIMNFSFIFLFLMAFD